MKCQRYFFDIKSPMLRINLLICGVLSGTAGQAQTEKPIPVVIIMADQLRTDALGAVTPHINALMKDGVNFSRAYCAVPLCAPSRASFFTGLYPNRTGSMINPWEKEDEIYGSTRAGIPNMYQMMEKRWDSYHVGKQHFFTTEKIDKDPASLTRWTTQADYTAWMAKQKKTKPGGKRFKDNAPEVVSGSFTRLRSYSTPVVDLYKEGIDFFLDRYIANESIAAIRNRDKSKPLLLNTMFLAPHPPFHVPDPYFSMFKTGDFTVPENVGRFYPGQSPLQMYSLTGFLGARYNREQWGQIWAKYLGLVKLLDDEVGRLIAVMKEEGIYDDAIIIFTADHGEMLGSHSLWQKMCMYEESAKVPLIVKLPKNRKPAISQSDVPVSLVDILPTILELTGLPGAEKMDGRSLLPLMLKGKPTSPDSLRPIFVQFDGNGSLGNAQRCVVKGEYKLIIDTFKDERYVELYNVVKDPGETVNLALNPKFKAQAEALLAETRLMMKRTGDRLVLPDDLVNRFLETYGKPEQKGGGEN
jgi:arylsulfatase A-like enzyme